MLHYILAQAKGYESRGSGGSCLPGEEEEEAGVGGGAEESIGGSGEGVEEAPPHGSLGPRRFFPWMVEMASIRIGNNAAGCLVDWPSRRLLRVHGSWDTRGEGPLVSLCVGRVGRGPGSEAVLESRGDGTSLWAAVASFSWAACARLSAHEKKRRQTRVGPVPFNPDGRFPQSI